MVFSVDVEDSGIRIRDGWYPTAVWWASPRASLPEAASSDPQIVCQETSTCPKTTIYIKQ